MVLGLEADFRRWGRYAPHTPSQIGRGAARRGLQHVESFHVENGRGPEPGGGSDPLSPTSSVRCYSFSDYPANFSRP